MKFVNGLSSLIKQQVKLAVDWYMSLEQIVNKVEQVQATMKQTHKPPPMINQNRKPSPPSKQWSAGKPMEFVKSNYKFPNEKKKIAAPAAKAKGGPGRLYGNFPSPRKRKHDMANVLSFEEREKHKHEGKCYHCKHTSHMVSQCPQKKPMTSSYQKINQQQYQNRNRNPKLKTAALNIKTQSVLMQVMKGPTQSRSFIIPEARKETMATEITINGYKAHVLLYPYTQGGDLISNNFCTLFKLPLTQMEKKPLGTAIQGSRSPMTNKTTVLINVQGFEEERTFYAANLRNSDAILGEPVLKTLKAIMNIHDNMISIQPPGMAKYDIIML